MTTSVDAIRQDAGWLLEGPRLIISTATAGDENWLQDTVRLKNASRREAYERGFVYRYTLTTTNRLRQVSRDDTDEGKLWVDPDWTVAPVSTDPYEAWSAYDPLYEVEVAIQRAINQLNLPEEIGFAGLGATTFSQDLSDTTWQTAQATGTFNWLVSPDQVIGVYERTGSAGAYTYTLVQGATVRFDRGTATLFLPYGFASTQSLHLRAWRTVGDVVTVTTTADRALVPISSSPRMVNYAGLWTAHQILAAPYQPRINQDSAQRNEALQRVREQILVLRNQIQPQTPRPMFASSGGADAMYYGPSFGG